MGPYATTTAPALSLPTLALLPRSSQEFSRNPTSVKHKADEGPVFITEHGRAAYVVVNIEDYRRLQGAPRPDLVTYLQSEDPDDYDLPPVQLAIDAAKL